MGKGGTKPGMKGGVVEKGLLAATHYLSWVSRSPTAILTSPAPFILVISTLKDTPLHSYIRSSDRETLLSRISLSSRHLTPLSLCPLTVTRWEQWCRRTSQLYSAPRLAACPLNHHHFLFAPSTASLHTSLKQHALTKPVFDVCRWRTKVPGNRPGRWPDCEQVRLLFPIRNSISSTKHGKMSRVVRVHS